ncbi:MAG TPA: aconitase/3-isopropylmalate dehydratase large subunit family protein [Syntrophorhabdaceae bacterium]|nr:aconitase/3-isopropylmalate dehydratase large subunit family protein [Syntrophorhabdaceae bacterium]
MNKQRGMTITEKILSRAAGRSQVLPGEYVTAAVDAAMMNDNIRYIPVLLEKAGVREGAFKVWDGNRLVVAIDHRVPASALIDAANQKKAREAAISLNAGHFYDIFAGVSHQVMVEKGHVLPGELVVGADSHATTYGALNALGTGIGVTEMAYVLKTGQLWFKVPETIKMELTGRLPEFVSAKDIALFIAGRYGTDVAQYQSIEWSGPGVAGLSIEGRMTLANMSLELGAKFGVFQADKKTREYLRNRTTRNFEAVDPDPDARYIRTYSLDVGSLTPQVALPHNVGNVNSVADAAGIPIQQAVIASCCNGRITDVEAAVRIVRGRKIKKGVRFYVNPASHEVYKAALDKGFISDLIDAGAMIGIPSCGFCTSFGGAMAAGETCIAALPRNFKGRMGTPDSKIYLASPETVAASAVSGYITDPRELGCHD